jgi:hypothetical protein
LFALKTFQTQCKTLPFSSAFSKQLNPALLMPTEAVLKQLLQHREPEDEEFSDTVLEVSMH